ncbi:MAG TPA: hypothetical protein PLP50_13050 [Thermoanaerobaculia bacterium]|nr:hypothetical protein [Thermoanaerobaculia bacterium]HQN08551.1 hypothetical protein [Thermoanaerobaculia bacterium]HQP88143.1 hypothetical protein [Thermoanaerobaculia bacterium]
MKKVNVLTLDDVLELSGPSLNLGATEATGATRVVLREGGEEIEFFTDASCDGGPAELDRRTSLTWDRGDVAVSKGRLTLKDKEEVELTFHWPNPLTPAGSGLWLRLAIVRDGAGHWVRMAQQYPATGATVWWRRLTSRPAWEEYRLPLRVPRVSVAQLLSVWKNQGFGYASGDPAAGSCPLVAGADGPACLVELDARERGRGVFLLAAEKRWASARFRAEGVRARTGQRALGLSELGFAPRPYVFQGDLDLRSAGGPREFFLEWPGIPAGGPLPSEVLSLQALWQEVAQHYALGLAATRARRHLTFVPTELQGRSDPVNLHIRVAADPRSAGGPPLWKANLFQIGPVDCRLDLVLGGARTEEGCALRVPVWARSSEWKPIVDHLHDRFVKERPTIPPLLGLGLDLDSASDRPVSSALVVSGVRFDVQGFERGRLRCTAEPGADVHGRPPLGVDLRLDFTVSTPRAATQDPEIGFETQSSWLGRERPICVDLSEETRTTFDLCVVERATGGLSRLLRLTVRAPEGLGSLTTDTFVLDPSPLQVARVLTANKLEEGTVLAEYTDDSDLPPEWAFRTETGQMDIVLPPQVIGEEMIKGKLAVGGKPVPDPNALFDFRLSAPAYLRLDRTDVDAARASAPWALRRLLSQRLGVTGVRLQEAIFELLYGLTTTLRAPGLRIAELDAFVGRVPFADELCALLGVEIEAPDATGELTVAELRRRHATDLARWIRALLHRPAQMPVFREWTDRRKLTLFEGVGFALRPSRQTAHPFDLTSFADRTPPDQHDKARRPLRGGVDFPFETRSIYEAFRRSTTPNDGTVSGLTFGSLGGTGGQQATPVQDRSVIA